MTKYYLSPEAQSSLKSIKQYSTKQFGKERTKAYLLQIRTKMNDLAEKPSRGIIREDLKVEYHSYFIGSHTIYYRIKPSHIDIIDILHQSMDPTRQIKN